MESSDRTVVSSGLGAKAAASTGRIHALTGIVGDPPFPDSSDDLDRLVSNRAVARAIARLLLDHQRRIGTKAGLPGGDNGTSNLDRSDQPQRR